MNERIKELIKQCTSWSEGSTWTSHEEFDKEKFAESMIAEFSDVVKTAANELAEHYYRQGCSEEEVLMRVNGALVVLGHIRARFKD